MAARVYTLQAQVLYLPAATTTFTRSVTHSGVVTDSVGYTADWLRVLFDNNIVAQSVDRDSTIFKSVADAGVVSDSVVEETGKFVSTSSSILLTQSTLDFVEFGGYRLEQDLNLQQTVDVEGYEQASNDLNLIQTADTTGPIYRSTESVLFLSQTASGVFGLRWGGYEVSHDLGMTDIASAPVFLDVTDNLNLQQEAFPVHPVEQALGLNQLIVAGFGYDAENELELVGTASRDLILNQDVSHTNSVRQSLAYFIESACSKKRWEGFHGEGGVAPGDQKLNYDSSLMLQSTVDPSDIVHLRNPETDDRRRVAFQRVNRDHFDGTPDIYRDPSWVTEETQLYTLIATKRTTLDTLWQFLLDNLGQEVMVKDWKGVTWKAVITNPGEVYTEDDEGYWTLNFEVVGSAIDGEFAAHHIDLGETLSRSGSIWTRQVEDDLGVSQGVSSVWDWSRSQSDPISLNQTASYSLV